MAAQCAAVRASRERQVRPGRELGCVLEPGVGAITDGLGRAVGGGDGESPLDGRAALHDLAPHAVNHMTK
eukprot:SAG31_NODE_469_length_15244_cov_11.537141_22_plen_70_part_00